MKHDVVIIGGGPGGSACAMFLQQLGVRSAIVEKESFPRFHVGESMTGECGSLVRALGLEERMSRARHPTKNNVTVYGPTGRNAWRVDVKSRSPEGDLVPSFTWQVRRSDFDAMLLEEAQARGAELFSGRAVEPLRDLTGRTQGVRVELAGGGTRDLPSQVLVDASGQANFLSRAGVAGRRRTGRYDKQVAIFSHVTGMVRDRGADSGATLIFYREKFHWAWCIPLDDDVTSVGVVVPAAYFRDRGEEMTAFYRRELSELNPELARRLPDVSQVEPVRAFPNYSYEVGDYTGPGFVCIGDSHRFIDPIFSFGMFVTMKEAQMAASAITAELGAGPGGTESPFRAHREACDRGLDAVEDLIEAFWKEPLGFAYLVHHRHPGLMVDLFAGRLWDDRVAPALASLRDLVAHRQNRTE
ncbi:MAG: NAD(P)/FAD-dependent oxidoreductase [Thermoanaerobaculia bacterium]